MSTITITFGDQAENHRGMQKIGKMEERGYSKQELLVAKGLFQERGYVCEFIDLNQYIQEESDQAAVLVIKGGVQAFLANSQYTSKQLFDELVKLEWDSKILNYGKVMNKRARYNLCFGDNAQEPVYEQGKGRIIPWNEVPILSETRKNLGIYLKGAEELVAEGNYYYDNTKCGVKFHGDEERKKVVALRLCTGECPPLHYQWFLQGKPIGGRAIIELNDKDAYIMSEKASGNDAHKRKIPTLKHATGCSKFTALD